MLLPSGMEKLNSRTSVTKNVRISATLWIRVQIWVVENITDLRKPPADTVSRPSREGKPCIEGGSDRLPLLDSEGIKPTSLRTLLTEF